MHDPELITKARGWNVAAVFDSLPFSPAYLQVLKKMATDPEAPGHSDIGVRNLLFSVVLNTRPENVLEIGGHIGSATVVIAEALRINGFGRLYTLEPQQHYFDLLTKYMEESGGASLVRAINGYSYEADVRKELLSVAPFELIFLDACHDYAAVFDELNLCVNLIAENGFIICHDTSLHAKSFDSTKKGGVRAAILDFCNQKDSALSPLFFEYPLWLNDCGAAILCKQNVLLNNKNTDP